MSICSTTTPTGEVISTICVDGPDLPSHLGAVAQGSPAPLPVSLFGVLSFFVLLFLLGWIVFRQYLTAFPGMSKKKIFVVIGIVTLGAGCYISWHVLHGIYQYIAPLVSGTNTGDAIARYLSLPTYGSIMGICIPAALLLLIVLIGRIGKKLSLPAHRKSKKIALVLCSLLLLGIALAFILNAAVSSLVVLYFMGFCLIFTCVSVGKLFKVVLQLPAKKQSLKLAYSIYPAVALILFAVLWWGSKYIWAISRILRL